MNKQDKPGAAANGEQIDIDEARELRHWTSKLKVDEDKLKQVVARVGNSVTAVRNAVGR